MAVGAELDPIIGRDADLATIEARLADARLVTLTGPGGSGKTRLAEAAAARLRDGGREAWFVDASTVDDVALLSATIATALRIEGGGSEGPLDAVREMVADRDVVLAIDNVEQIVGADRFVAGLLESIPGLRALVTSRTRLGVRGEVELAVRPLDVPSGGSIAALEASDAGRLFVARARAAGQLLVLDEPTAAAIGELLRRLDGLPLAVELAAARTRVLSPAEILARLDSHGIGALDASRSDPHRSLGRIIEWSRELLDDSESRLLDAVSICAGFDVAMAEALVADIDAVAAIDGLITVGLVQRAGMYPDATRFRLLETVRAAVRPTLPDSVVSDLRDRHATAIAALVEEQAGREGSGAADVRARLDAEADNIRLALDWFDASDPERGLVLWSRLFYPFWATRARLREGMARFERTSGLVQEPSTALSRALILYAMNERWVGDETAMIATLRRVLDVSRSVGDRESEVAGLATLAATALNAGSADLAREVDAALSDFRDEGLPPELLMRVAEARGHAAAAIHGQGSDEALRHLDDAIRFAEQTDGSRAETAVRGNQTIALLHRGDHDRAVEAGERAVALARRFESPLATWAAASLAMALAESGAVDRAIDTISETIAETLAGELSFQTGDTMLAAMPVALAAGRPLLAARLWGAVTALVTVGVTDIPAGDRELAERTLARVRRKSGEVEVELAIRDGAADDPIELLRSVPGQLAAVRPDPAAPRLRHGDLTRREVEVLGLLAAGRSDGEIAAELFISPKTASVHVTNVKAKLGVETRLEAALKGRDMGFGGS